MEKNTTAIEKSKEGQQKTRGELEAVKEGCKLRHEEMTGMVREMGQKVETETREMGERLEKHGRDEGRIGRDARGNRAGESRCE